MKIFKKIIIFLGVIFCLFLILLSILFFVIRNLKIKDIVEDEIEQSLGIKVTIEKIDFSPLLAHIGLSGITIHNPPGFGQDELAYINSIHFVCDPAEILIQKKPNIYLFTLNLQRLNIIKNQDGKVNIKEIIPIDEDHPQKHDQKTSFYFDVLVLSVGEVIYIEHTAQGSNIRRYPIGLKNATFVGLKDEDEVIKQVIYKAIEHTDIGKLINLTIMPVITQLTGTLDAAWGTAKSGVNGIFGLAAMPFKMLFNKN